MSRDEKIVKILKRVLPIMSILTLFVFVMLINKKSYALFHKRIETDITIHISTADRMPGINAVDALKQGIQSKKNSGTCNPVIEEDGITYLSGDNNCIDFNYVWYSGKLWRITAIYPDGTMKMVTQDEITTIAWNANSTYKDSWIYQWLNEDFKDTLYNYENIIVQNADWNATLDGNSSPVKPPTDSSAKIVSGDVGLLNAYEYRESYRNTTYLKGYLNIGYFWWLITPYSNSRVWDVSYNGALRNNSPNLVSISGTRPSINLKSNVEFDGKGTKSNPYTITIDKTLGKPGELISSRISGEYVRVDNKVYRIVGIENGTAKLTSVDYVRDASGTVLTREFGSNTSYETSVTSVSSDYWGYYLNNTWLTPELQNYITEGTYYLGKVGDVSYKNSICSASNTSKPTSSCEKTSNTWTGKVGLPRVGEMFSAQLGGDYTSSNHMYLITTYDTSDARLFVSNNNFSNYYLSHYYSSYMFAVRPSINLKSEVVIASGSGTEQSPYEIELPS